MNVSSRNCGKTLAVGKAIYESYKEKGSVVVLCNSEAMRERLIKVVENEMEKG